VSAVNDRIIFEEQLLEQNFIVQPGTSVKFHLDLFKTSARTLKVGDSAIKNLEASIQLVNQLVPVHLIFDLVDELNLSDPVMI